MALVIVGGALANKCHNGGEAWVRLSWALGLKRLGCHVVLVEEIAAKNCVDTGGRLAPFAESENRRYFEQVTSAFGLQQSAALFCADGTADQIHGMNRTELEEVVASADLLVNISGHLSLGRFPHGPRRTAYIDIDPGFTQIWHVAGNAGARLAGHDFYYTIAENIGQPVCDIPMGGIPWRPIRQPVVLEDWHAAEVKIPDRFTTVASWRCPFGPLSHGGRTYGLKLHEFRKVVELPRRSRHTYEIALAIHPADGRDRKLLLDHGWNLVDPEVVACDPDAFRRYVQASSAEFSVAQGVYVDTRSGWFSDRTIRYLASGKPALVQDTGLAHSYPVGEGLVTFRTFEEAANGADRIARNYRDHCVAARALAERYFDSDKVLSRLLEETGVRV